MQDNRVGEKVANPADEVSPSSIAHFMPRDRSLSPAEIRIMLKQLDHAADDPARDTALSSHDGAEERTARCDLG